jgi:hypothetical protein
MRFLLTFVQIQNTLINLDDCRRIIYRVVNSYGKGEISFQMINHYLPKFGGDAFKAVNISQEQYHDFVQALADGIRLVILN